jgi:hypothetical protein
MTKEEAHYGEVHFCSFCKYIQFRYGDYYCSKLDVPIAESGFCDLFEKEGKPTPQKPAVVARTCSNCIHNMGGMCGKTGELTKKACSMHATEIEPPVFGEDIVGEEAFEIQIPEFSDVDLIEHFRECTTCVDAYYDAKGIAMCKRFNAQLDMQDLTACEEYNEDPEVSNDETSENDDQ